MRMVPCARCHQHLFQDAKICPHCSAENTPIDFNAIRPTVGALLMGLTAASGLFGFACAEYGVAMTIPSDIDNDNDGFSVDDCNDSDPEIHPEAEEIYYDGVDQNCDGLSDYDADHDGWESDTYGGQDCDDDNADIHPEAEETPSDGVDSNCDGEDDS